MSRDDSDLATMLEGTALGSAPVKGSGGLKGKLRRALSLGVAHALTEEDEREGGKSPSGTGAAASPSTASPADGADASSTTPPGGSTTTKKRSRAASLFNTRLNASTDNISLSSTMSSASVVIRKIGSIGKLARRNSLAGITSLFKDKNRDRDNNDTATGNPTPTGENDDGTTVAGKKKGKSKRNKDSGGGSGKGAVLEPTISHAVAELDRSGGEWSDASMSGLSPAAKLVRQHTLREKAREAEAQAQAQQAQARVNGSGSGANGVNGTNGANGTDVPVPATWEKNTSTGRDGAYVRKGVGEDGRVVVEDDSDSGSDAEHHDSHSPAHPHAQQGNFISEGWEDDEVWREEEDEDVTVRAPIGAKMTEDVGTGDDEEVVEWARTMRRTIECTRPAKGILKGASVLLSSASTISNRANIQGQAAMTRKCTSKMALRLLHVSGQIRTIRIPLRLASWDHLRGCHRLILIISTDCIGIRIRLVVGVLEVTNLSPRNRLLTTLPLHHPKQTLADHHPTTPPSSPFLIHQPLCCPPSLPMRRFRVPAHHQRRRSGWCSRIACRCMIRFRRRCTIGGVSPRRGVD